MLNYYDFPREVTKNDRIWKNSIFLKIFSSIFGVILRFIYRVTAIDFPKTYSKTRLLLLKDCFPSSNKKSECKAREQLCVQ